MELIILLLIAFAATGVAEAQDVRTSATAVADTVVPNPHFYSQDSVYSPYAGRKVRIRGYRVQVYSGGNSRDAKLKAMQAEGRIRTLYPDMPVYTHFVTPRWLCHVGDFTNREDAVSFLRELRKQGGYAEAIVVKCKINSWVFDY